MVDEQDILDQVGAFSDEYLDVPERRCSCCRRMFRPTTVQQRLCRQCFQDATAHEARLVRALGEG